MKEKAERRRHVKPQHLSVHEPLHLELSEIGEISSDSSRQSQVSEQVSAKSVKSAKSKIDSKLFVISEDESLSSETVEGLPNPKLHQTESKPIHFDLSKNTPQFKFMEKKIETRVAEQEQLDNEIEYF